MNVIVFRLPNTLVSGGDGAAVVVGGENYVGDRHDDGFVGEQRFAGEDYLVGDVFGEVLRCGILVVDYARLLFREASEVGVGGLGIMSSFEVVSILEKRAHALVESGHGDFDLLIGHNFGESHSCQTIGALQTGAEHYLQNDLAGNDSWTENHLKKSLVGVEQEHAAVAGVVLALYFRNARPDGLQAVDDHAVERVDEPFLVDIRRSDRVVDAGDR